MILLPQQTGELLPAVGADKFEFTTTVVVPAPLEHPNPLEHPEESVVMVTLYVPAIAAVAFIITGFWLEDENPFGPVQL